MKKNTIITKIQKNSGKILLFFLILYVILLIGTSVLERILVILREAEKDYDIIGFVYYSISNITFYLVLISLFIYIISKYLKKKK